MVFRRRHSGALQTLHPHTQRLIAHSCLWCASRVQLGMSPQCVVCALCVCLAHLFALLSCVVCALFVRFVSICLLVSGSTATLHLMQWMPSVAPRKQRTPCAAASQPTTSCRRCRARTVPTLPRCCSFQQTQQGSTSIGTSYFPCAAPRHVCCVLCVVPSVCSSWVLSRGVAVVVMNLFFLFVGTVICDA